LENKRNGGRRPVYSEKDYLHISLQFSETRKLGNQFLSRKWLIFNEEVYYNGIISYTNGVELRLIENYLYKVRCTWDNKISKA
jgi:hypothetical protein